ncbi:DUF6089 family protein [Bacteroidia bacterium]|nr:DUF6089 family protein [Bacteroidia bacterium]MDC1395788.1 DUF6089 family protein [Bacteroidia bacterium]
MKRLTVLSIAAGVGFLSFGQTSQQNSWSYNIFLGGSNLLGDLGGSNTNGSFGVKDFDLKAVRPAIGIGNNYTIGRFSLGSNLTYTRLVGDDAFTALQGRNERNLRVRTDLIEMNLLGELRPFGNTPVLKRVYFTGGVGGIFYQPKAEYNDEWVKLRPLGTEGQNLDGGKTYSKISLVVPYGIGYKFPLGQTTTLNLDIGLRKTFTDYLDDISTVYADNAALLENDGALAAVLADRSSISKTEGSQRGNPEKKDSYFFVGLKFEKTIGKSTSSCYYDDVPMNNKRRIKRQQRKMFRR